MVLELDLIGRRATLDESDVRWLYALAKTTGGSSLGSRDLATRLKSLNSSQGVQRLHLSRTEARALQRLLDAGDEPTDGLRQLRTILTELLTPNGSQIL